MSAVARNLLNLLSPAGRRARLMVFPYHRVQQNEDPLLPGTPSTARFERQLQRIRRYLNPLPLAEAIERLRAGTLPARAVALTFDDGYANNLQIAAPLLNKYGIPATVFVAVDAVERGIMWNDILIEAVRGAGERIDAGALGLAPIELTGRDRLAVANELISQALYMPTQERLAASEAVWAANADRDVPRQMMTPDQVRELAELGITIGAHTVNHPILRSLPEAEAREEIDASRRWLEDVTGQAVTLFAYPNGKLGKDYDHRHADMVRDLGFIGAVAANWGCATRDSSTYELPRFKPWEDTDTGFAKRLCKVVARTYLDRPQTQAA